MTHLEKLQSSPMSADRVLADFIMARGEKAVALVNASKAFNRGDFAEMALTLAPVARDGLHGISKGDAVIVRADDALIVEIKYLTKKTSASEALKGTIASHYLIAFNDGKALTLRLIPKNEVVTRMVSGTEKIAYNDNASKGEAVSIDGLAIVSRDKAVEALSHKLEEAKSALWYAEMANDYLYTRGNGYQMQHDIDALRSLITLLK